MKKPSARVAVLDWIRADPMARREDLTGTESVRAGIHNKVVRTCIFVFLGWLSAVGGTAGLLRAADWAQYRGPDHDGRSAEIIRTNWSGEAPLEVWKVPMDPGLSSFSVSGGRVFTLVRRSAAGQAQEFCVALDAATGAEMWASPALGQASYPNGGVGSDDGPRSTPSVLGDRVYVMTSYLRLYCLNATNGAVVWNHDLVTEYGSAVVPWQSAASPLIEGDLVFAIGNAAGKSLLAFHAADGSEAWKGQSDVMTQASPVAASVAGVRQVIYFARSGLVSVAPDSGSVLWRYPFPFSTSTGASPVVGDDIVYCSAAYGVGAGAVQIAASGAGQTATQIWRTVGANMNHWPTPVAEAGYLYGVYGQEGVAASLRCVDLATGTERWRQLIGGMGGTLFTTGCVLLLTEDGQLVLVRPDPVAYNEVARYRALDGSKSSIQGLPVKCWNVPAISGGRIYVRSTTEAVCLDVATAAPAIPALRLLSTIDAGSGMFRLIVGTEDGSALDTNRAARIGIFAAGDLGAGAGGWTQRLDSAVFSNGQVVLDDPASTGFAHRFFRVEEGP